MKGEGEEAGSVTEPRPPSERQAEILRFVAARSFATLEELALRFAVSTQTIRRDVIQLDKLGLLQRFHGGAGVPRSARRLGYAEKKAASGEAKARIGRAVARLVPEGAVLFLDVGTTCEAVARALAERQGLRVFTSSLVVGAVFAGRPGIETVVLGGVVSGADGSLTGPATLEQLAQLRLDLAVIGLSGFDEDGWAMDFDLHKVAIKRAAIARAARSLAAVDAGKFLRTAVLRVAPLDAFALVATDAPPPPAFARLAEAAGTQILVAEG